MVERENNVWCGKDLGGLARFVLSSFFGSGIVSFFYIVNKSNYAMKYVVTHSVLRGVLNKRAPNLQQTFG